jgi:hypothetical protein
MRILIVNVLFLFCFQAFSQEFNCQISIATPKLQTADPKVFASLEGDIQEFVNEQVWTNIDYMPEEKIKLTLQLNIKEELGNNAYSADLLIQAVRPVFNSDYETPLITHSDKDVTFTYDQSTPIQFTQNIYSDNLSSILSFYVYLILGLDYDSFSPNGGDQYFQEAQNIINVIPSNAASSYKGWRSLDANQNRFWLLESITNPRTKGLRDSYYKYHRLGLDVMHNNTAQGRSEILKCLEAIDAAARSYLNAMCIQMFITTKSSEIVEIFKMGTIQEKNRSFQILRRLDPSNGTKYEKIRA